MNEDSKEMEVVVADDEMRRRIMRTDPTFLYICDREPYASGARSGSARHHQ